MVLHLRHIEDHHAEPAACAAVLDTWSQYFTAYRSSERNCGRHTTSQLNTDGSNLTSVVTHTQHLPQVQPHRKQLCMGQNPGRETTRGNSGTQTMTRYMEDKQTKVVPGWVEEVAGAGEHNLTSMSIAGRSGSKASYSFTVEVATVLAPTVTLNFVHSISCHQLHDC